MTTQKTARIVAMETYLPEKVLSNKDLEALVETSDEWIFSRTGMKERRVAAEGECTSDMGAAAAQKVLDKTGIAPEDIDLIIVGTMSPDYLTPSTACIIQSLLGANNAAAFDFQAACSGFVYGLPIAKAFVESGIYKNVLLIASEKMTSFVDYEDRGTCILFGDGAAAALIQTEGKGLAIGQSSLGSDGEQAPLLMLPAGGCRAPSTKETVEGREHYYKMNGREVFKHAVRRMEASLRKCLEKADLEEKDIAYLVPHQANLRIIEAIAKRFDIADEKVYLTIHKYGNTSASAVAIALHELNEEGNLKVGDNLALVAFGAGLTWGAAILTLVD